MNRKVVDISSQTSRQVSPLTNRLTSPIPYNPQRQPIYIRALVNGLKYGIPAGAASLVTYYRKPIYNTIKDIANYGKRMTINTLAAIRNTPYKVEPYSPDSSDIEDYPHYPHKPPKPTPLPNPTVDVHHPKTSI